MSKTAAESPTKIKTIQELPPIPELFQEAWTGLKNSWQNLLLAEIVAIAAGFGIVIMFFVLLFGSGVAAGIAVPGIANNPDPEAIMKLISPGTIGITALLVISIIIFGTYLQMAVTSAMIYSVYESDNKPTFGKALGHGFRTSVPMILTGAISGILIIGGFGLLIIPGLIISIFLTFIAYEVSTQNRKYFDALKESYNIVSSHFWEIVIRAILIGVASFLITSTPSAIADALNMRESVVFTVLYLIISVVSSFYTMVFTTKLYKQAREATPVNSQKNMTWIYVVSIIGWVVLFFVGSASFSLIGKALESIKENPEFQQDFERSLRGEVRVNDSENNQLMDEVDTMFEESEDNLYRYQQEVQE